MVNSGGTLQRILITWWLIVGSAVANAEANARVDRSVIAVDESLTLTLSIDRSGSVHAPELSGIRSNFHIVGNNQSSQHSYSNGKSESLTQWIITLIPKQVGQLIIPAIIIEGEKTLAIAIDVRPSIPHSIGDILPVYLESDIDNKEVTVQQQIIYTLRIFQSIELDNMNVSEPEFDHAAIKKLSQNSYKRRIKNTPYRVHELRYAIFPQQSGQLTIPEAVFTANEQLTRRSIFSMPGQGKAIRKMSQQHTVTVKGVPSTFKGKIWLPAKSLKLTQTWSADPDELRVGESITRSITLAAENLLDSQLPPVDFPSMAGAKLYPDKGQTESTETDQGVNSSRTDSTALIPTREGPLTLPEIRISWWDTHAKKMREALIPETTLRIKPALADTLTTIPTAIDHSQLTKPSSLSPPVTIIKSNAIYWQITCVILTLAWLCTLYGWFSLKRQLPKNNTKPSQQINTSNPTEKQALKTLASVCHQNDITKVRQALILWAQAHWPAENIHSLQDVQKFCAHMPLTNALLHLDTLLYGNSKDSTQWNGENLLTTIKQLQESNKKEKQHSTQTLTPLYPQ